MNENKKERLERKVYIRIVPDLPSDKPLNSKHSFWSFISRKVEKESNYPEKLEYTFKKRFTRELKQNLINKFKNELRNFEKTYSIEFNSRVFDEYFHHLHFRKSERNNFDDYLNSVAKLQQLKNDYFKDNVEYQQLLNKYLLANQIDFGIENITYSSLGFDLNIEPFEKIINLFDNKFEYFKVFLDQYISESFFESLSINDNNLPISTSIQFSQSFKTEFENPITNKISPTINEPNNSKKVNKWDKAKWVWAITNSSLIVPVVLALIVLYITFNKIENVFKIRQENYQEMNIENDKILKNYQELIEIQKNSYKGIINEIRKDTIK